ncbi:MAG: response regulator [Butyrivibrio sp.]|nr:response regulator [Butyrivibrio sp.]
MNILIIDDEPLVLQNVSEQVTKMGLDISIVDCAGNTTMADELIKQKKYDIFLCDIVMPGEDGISFAKRVLNENDDCKFIFLTAHADYQYMKEAISIQSFDYVLQPVSEHELKAVLESAIIQLTIERKNNKLISLGKLFENEQEDILDGNAMRYLLGLTDNSSFLKHLIENKTGGKADDLKILPVLAQIIQSDKQWNEADRSLLRSIYYNVVDEITDSLHSQNIIILRSDKKGSFMLLLCFRDVVDDMEEIKGSLEKILVLFQKSLKISLELYYAGITDAMDIRNSFKDILEEQSSNVTRESKMYFVGQLSQLDVDDFSLDTQRKEWKSLLDNGDTARFYDGILRFINYKKNANDLNREVLMKLHQTVSELMLSYMVNNNINSNDVFDSEITYTDFMYCWDSSDNFVITLSKVIRKINTNGKSGNIILDITNYISENIGREIFVSEIADYIGMNPEYLTRYFKKEQGISIKKYIDKERIDRSKQLLQNTDISVTDIAEKVGYSGYSNYARAFKQHTGISPTSYRENIAKK